ncbi:MAG: hypothetical protein L0G87_13610 [Renibacterium salmoninarum]|nr:hypothetical protein [Renibacterium salmoninarum]
MSRNPETLSCGRTLDQLSDYLDAGRQPADPYIDTCAECQAALHALEQLNALTSELVDQDSREQSEADADWLGSIFSNIAFEARSGRSIPIDPVLPEAAGPGDELSQTEGAVISLIRAAGDELDNAMIGRCRLEGDVTEPGAEIRVDIRVTALWGAPLQRLAKELRRKIYAALALHTQLTISGIDIAIIDIQRAEELGDDNQ